MALTGRLFLQPIRVSLSSSLSRSTIPFCERFVPMRTWIKGLEPALGNYVRGSNWKLCVQRYRGNNFCKSGSKFAMGSLIGVSVACGSIYLGPRVAYAMDGFDILDGDNRSRPQGDSEEEEDPRVSLAFAFARKWFMSVFLLITVLMNWDHPFILMAKVVLILVGTKPRPFSVYLYIEQLRRQIMHQHPFLYKFKSLYAKKAEVEDYKVLCVARVELEDQKLTLIGILGCWWVLPQISLPQSPRKGGFSVFRDKILQGYMRN